MMQESQEKIEFYFKVLARYDQYIQLANTKASNHITLLSSILVAITALVGWGITFNNLDCFTGIIIFLYLVFLILSHEWYTRCMAVIHPNRMRSTSSLLPQNENELSTIFYSDVAKFINLDNFKNQIDLRDDAKQLEDLVNQVYIMAKITEKKFDDYEKVNSIVKGTVIFSVLILFFTCFSKMNG